MSQATLTQRTPDGSAVEAAVGPEPPEDEGLVLGRPVEDRSFEAVETVAGLAAGMAIGAAVAGPIGAAAGGAIGAAAGLTAGEALERAEGPAARTTDAGPHPVSRPPTDLDH